MNIGLAIKTLRICKLPHLKQHEFAEKVGISQTYISQIENNKKIPSMDVLQHMCKVFNVPLPIMFWFSISRHDVESVEDYELLVPIIDIMIKKLFKINQP